MKIHVGAAYYPETCDNDRVRYDADLMKKAGISFVRMGEFAWSSLEPHENEFQFQWLHDAVRIFAEYGIQSVLCTPSSAAPAWMCRKYPEIMSQRRSGQKSWFGIRDHTCYTSSKYRFFVLRMAARMAEEFQNDSNIYAWQIDNEPGASRFSECFCPECQTEFRKYLRKKYGSLEELNHRWDTTFWSGRFTDWEEIELDSHSDNMGAGRTYDSYVFRSSVMASFILQQAEEIRKRIPHAVIGTNNYSRYDRNECFSHLDYAGNDVYPWYTTGQKSSANLSFYLALYRGLIRGSNPWIMETHTAPGAPLANRTEFYFRLFIAHGYDKICYFCWRNHLSGNEKTHPAIIGPSGLPGSQYETLRRIIAETDRAFAPYPDLPRPRISAAIVNDYRDNWIYCGTVPEQVVAKGQILDQYYTALTDSGCAPDIISPEADFRPYKLLILPIQAHISRKLAAALEEFTGNGGIVIMNGRSGTFDGDAKLIPQYGPEHTEKLFGITILEGMEFLNAPKAYEPSSEFEKNNFVVAGTLDGHDVIGTAAHWLGTVRTSTAEIRLTYKTSDLAGTPFLTVNQFGAGYAFYYASDRVDQQLLYEIIRHAERLLKLPDPEIPKGVDFMTRGDLLFLSNFLETEVSWKTKMKAKNVLGKAWSEGIFRLAPCESAVVEVLR